MAKLADAYFFHLLTRREINKVAAVAMERTFAAEDVIVKGNTDLTSLYVVANGKVRVSVPLDERRSPAGGREEVLGHIGPGECFGEFSYADRKAASAWIIAERETVVFEIPHRDFDQLLDAEPALARKVLKAMLGMVVSRFRSTDADLVLARYVSRYV